MSVPVEPPCCWQAPWRLPCPRLLLRKRAFELLASLFQEVI